MTAWEQAVGVFGAGATLTVFAGAVARGLPAGIRVHTTLARGRLRIPYRALGLRALSLHDALVARALPRLAGEIDLVHAWPLAARETLRQAKRLGIPTVLERPNAHTRFAYEVVAAECARLGVTLPPNHEHAYNAGKLAKEEEEYDLADFVLCPSEFVAQTFRDRGFSEERLVRHTYGYDDKTYYPRETTADADGGLNALFVGVCAVRKGIHYGLEAWLRSSASLRGRLRIAGEFLPDYRAVLREGLNHPSVEVLGHSNDVPELMRGSDVLLLPSIEEGFGLVCVEAMGSGCVPLVSDACTDVVRDGEVGFVHPVGDVDALTKQLTQLDQNRTRLCELRSACLRAAPDHTWSSAGERLVEAYEDALRRYRRPSLAAAA